MKKLIAIAVVFALIAGTAFADTAISGTVETRFTLIEGNNLDQHDTVKNNTNSVNSPNNGGSAFSPRTFGSIGTAYLQFSGSNENGTVGALWRFRNTDVVRANAWWHRAFIWWRPIPQMRIFLGIDQDGMYSTGDALTDWQFHQGVEDYIAVHDWGFWRGVFPGHWDSFGLSLSFYPAEGLNINLTIPTGNTGWEQAPDASVKNSMFADHLYLAGLKLQASYKFPDIGQLFVAYDGPGVVPNAGYYWDGGEAQKKGGDFGLLGASFLVEALRAQGLRFQLGIATKFVGEDLDTPFKVGLGLHFAQADWGVKLRAAGIFEKVQRADTITVAGVSVKVDEVNEVYFTANIMPWYKLSFMTIYCDLGLAIKTNDIDEGKRADAAKNDGLGFWINPYVKVPLGGAALEGGLIFRTSNIGTGQITDGIVFTAKDSDPTPIRYSIPIRFVFSF
jgi:hypothetical protein